MNSGQGWRREGVDRSVGIPRRVALHWAVDGADIQGKRSLAISFTAYLMGAGEAVRET